MKKLFDYQGNLTIEALIKFVKGELSAEENTLIEEAATKSQLIADAIDGYKNSSNLEKTKSSLDIVTSEISHRTGVKPINSEPPSLSGFIKPLLIGTGGLVVLLVAIWMINKEPSPEIEKTAKTEEVIPVSTPEIIATDTVNKENPDSVEIESPVEVIPVKETPKTVVPEPITEDTLITTTEIEEIQIDSLGVNPIMALLPATAQKMEHWGKIIYMASEDFLKPKPKFIPRPIVLDTTTVVKNDTATKNTKVVPEKTTVKNPVKPKEDKKDNNTPAVTKTDPSFVGGFNALQSYIAKNIDYPRTAERRGIEGTVFVKFIVTARGDVKNPSVVIGVDKRLDKEALRIVEGMPKWIPASENGKAIQKEHSIPVKFSLP